MSLLGNIVKKMPQKPSDFLTIFFCSDPAPAAHEMSGEDACADAV